MEGIGDGRQDVRLLLQDTWEIMWERNDQIIVECIFIVLYENMLCTSQLMFHLVATRSNNYVVIILYKLIIHRDLDSYNFLTICRLVATRSTK
jgi:hypothetical protein